MPTIEMTVERAMKDALDCIDSFLHFLFTFCITQDNKSRTERRFPKWDYIVNLAYKLSHNMTNLIINKCRQMAVSWVLAAYALWRILYFDNWNIAMVSKVGESAFDKTTQSFGGKVVWLWDHLPDHLKQTLDITYMPKKILNPANGSGLHMYNASDDAGRGGSCQEFIGDEAAFFPHADLIIKSVAPSVNRLILNSTFNGDDEEQFYYKTWNSKDNGWDRMEIDYYDNPEHTEETYNAECQKLDYDKQKIAQELDRNPSASIAGKIFSFDGSTNLVELNDAVIERDLENNCIFSGHDIGFGDGHAYVAGYLKDLVTFPRFYIFKDYYETRKTPPEIALQFKKDLLLYKHKSEQHIADPSGDNKGQDGGESMFKKFARPPLSIYFLPGKNDPRTIINTIETMLVEKTLIIHPRCKKLIEAIIHAQYPTDHSGRVRDYSRFVHNKYSHILMALGYVLMEIIGRVGRPVLKKAKRELNAYGEPVGA